MGQFTRLLQFQQYCQSACLLCLPEAFEPSSSSCVPLVTKISTFSWLSDAFLLYDIRRHWLLSTSFLKFYFMDLE